MKSFKITLVFIFFSLIFFNLSAQVDLTQGLISYYPFSGNANDASGIGNNGTVNGATLTLDRFGNANSAYYFDGTSSYISIAPTPLLNKNFTYSLWLNPTSNSSPSSPISIGSSGGGQGIQLVNQFLGGGYNDGTPMVTAAYSNTIPTMNTWYHIVLTRDDSFVSIYVNGQLMQRASTNSTLPFYGSNTKFAVIGRREDANTQYFNGVIDDVRIYNRAINDCEVAELAGVNSFNNGLAAYYPFSGNANDASGNGNNGTVNSATLTSDRFGNANSAYYFNGTNSHITLPSTSLLNKNYSYSVWINLYDNSSSYTILGIGSMSGDQFIQIVSPLGVGGGGYNIGSPSTAGVRSGIMPSLNTWYHLVMTRDDSTISFYINGILAGTSSTNNNLPSYGTSTTYAEIGMRENAMVQFFNGVIDDLRIYNRALSSCEISTLANDIPPLNANAGPDQSICTTSTSLSGNTPSIGSGTWTLISGSGTINNSSSATSSISNLGVGTNVFRWTVSYGNQSVYDDVKIISNGDLNNGLTAYYPFTGNANDASGNGNNGTVNNATLTNDRFGNSNSAYYFNGISSHITLPPGNLLNNNYSYSIWVNPTSNPSTSTILTIGSSGGGQGIQLNSEFVGGGYNSGSPMVTAAHSNTTPTMNTWYHIVLTRDDSYVSIYVNGLLREKSSTNSTFPFYGSNTIVAGIGMREDANVQFFNGVIDDVRIYNRALSSCEITTLANDIPPLSANAGTDQSICTTSTSLNGNSPSMGYGTWSLKSGSGTISNASNATTTVTSLGTGTNVFRWTVNYGNQTAYDEVTIVNKTLAPSNAGPDQNICNSTVNLVGNNPSSGNGSWSLISGTGNITSPNSASTSVSDLAFGTNVFMWTITNSCGTSSDMVNIKVDTYPSIANAGPDQNICTSTTDITANTPLNGSGTWTILSGSGVIDDPSSPISSVSSLSPGYTTCRWTISNGCGVSYDDVVIASHSTGNLTDGLIGKYDFSGNTNDLSGNFNNGAVYNVSLSTDRYGVSNSAYLFNGTNAYIALPPSSFLVSNYTYVAWVKTNVLPSDGSFASIISIGSEGGDQNFGIGNNYLGNSGWSLNSYTGVNKVDVYSSGSVPQTGQWYFVAATRDNQEINLYVNDQWIGALPVNGSAYYGTNTEGASIGSRSHNDFQFFNGTIDDVKIYGRALSLCELSDLYHQEATAISKPLNEDKVRIFPNPISEGILNIETSEVSSMEVLIYNALGTVVYKGQLTNGAAQIEIPFLVKGVYLLKLKTEDAEMNRKLEILN